MRNDKPNTHLCFVSPYAFPILTNSNIALKSGERGAAGGAEIHQILLAKTFREAGYRVSIVVDDYGQDRCEIHNGIEVVRCKFRYFPRRYRYFFIDTLRLIYVLRRVNADIYFLMNPRSLMLTLAVYKCLFGGKIINLIGEDVACTKNRREATKFLYDRGLRGVDYTIFQANSQKKCGQRILGLKGQVIRNPAHPWSGTVSSLIRDIDVLWVGLCSERKQPHYLLDVASVLSNVKFTMIAPPGHNKEFNKTVQGRAQSLVNVTFLPGVKYAEIGRYYQRAKIFAFTSSSEGFPNVFLQAFQSATPIVSYSVDPDGIIEKNKLGFVSKAVNQMSNDILFLLNNDKIRSEYGENGLRYVKENHRKEVIVQKFADIFEKLSS